MAAMSNKTDKEVHLQRLRDHLYLETQERDAWKGKPSEHYRMACILVAEREKEIAALMASDGDEPRK